MLENITLTKENKKYIRKQTLTFTFYLTLFLCLYFMIFAPDPAIIAICSFFLCIICLRRILFMICLCCNSVDFAPIIIKEKKIKRALFSGGCNRMLALEEVRVIIDSFMYNYQAAELGAKR